MSDAIAFAYLAALDSGDLDTLAAFWEHAMESPALADELCELTAAAAAEALDEQESLKHS